jgi:transposase-like protein
MKPNLTKLRKSRRFSEEFKQTLVNLFEKGEYSVQQLGELYSIAPAQIYRWIYKFSNFNKKGVRIVEMDKSADKKVKELLNRIKELEQAVGQKQMKIDFYEKLIEIAELETGYDIKKNSSIIPSAGTLKTKKDIPSR